MTRPIAIVGLIAGSFFLIGGSSVAIVAIVLVAAPAMAATILWPRAGEPTA